LCDCVFLQDRANNNQFRFSQGSAHPSVTP
jgi:hypothetical protein